MSPLEFMQRLAALAPRPRLHQIADWARRTALDEGEARRGLASVV